MKKLLLLLLVCSFTTLGNQFTVSAGYGISSSAEAGSSIDVGSVGNALNLNVKYFVGSSDDVSFGPYIDYVGDSEWSEDALVSSSILSYGIFARYKFPTNGFYFSGSIGLSSPSINDGDLLTALEQSFDSASFNSSVDDGLSYILTAGYELQDNFAVEASYKHTSSVYNLYGETSISGITQSGNFLSEEITFSTLTVGAAYAF